MEGLFFFTSPLHLVHYTAVFKVNFLDPLLRFGLFCVLHLLEPCSAVFLDLVLVSVAPVVVVHSATVVAAGIGSSLDVDIHLVDPQLIFGDKPFLTLVALKLFVLLFSVSMALVFSHISGRFEHF